MFEVSVLFRVDSLALLMTRVTVRRWLHTHTGHLHSVWWHVLTVTHGLNDDSGLRTFISRGD